MLIKRFSHMVSQTENSTKLDVQTTTMAKLAHQKEPCLPIYLNPSKWFTLYSILILDFSFQKLAITMAVMGLVAFQFS